MALLSVNGGRSARGLVIAAGLVVFGVVLNRLNVSIIGMLAGSHTRYVPSWMEIQVTLASIAAGILAYSWIAGHLPVFPERKTGGTARAYPLR